MVLSLEQPEQHIGNQYILPGKEHATCRDSGVFKDQAIQLTLLLIPVASLHKWIFASINSLLNASKSRENCGFAYIY